MRGRWGAMLAGALLLLVSSSEAAASEPTLTPSAAIACLLPAEADRSPLVYPEEALKRKDGGKVSVELRFDGPEDSPTVKWLDDQVFDELKSAVRWHVRQLRVPCMKAGDAPVVLRQDYVFIPNDGRKVVTKPPSDLADEFRRAQLRCLARSDKLKRPEYPPVSARAEEQGNVLVRLRFTSPERPPETQVLASTRHKYLRESVEEFVKGYRLPCLNSAELSFDQLFSFRMVGGARTHLKDMTLRSLVASAKELPRPAQFDLNTMQCPFDLRVTYKRPHLPNVVGELDQSVDERKPLLEWISKLALALPEPTNTDVLGDDFVLTVPCGKVDL